ncbi:MAG TPA: carboxypeptidase regulatory-like domain-containing protein [Tepidisphaeraceae bacterium]|nr:carboxypeptidase regulatory-like domain-containing protein [Tepidisphaeraceae bacterium]
MLSLLRRAFLPARPTVVSSSNNSSPLVGPAVPDIHPPNHLEPLESRTLLSTATPTPEEQFMLELINRARSLPAIEAKRYGITLNEGLPANSLSTSARQPLAFNLRLISAARQHSQYLISSKTFSHVGANGSNPQSRMSTAGYLFPASASAWAENLGWAGRRLITPQTADMVAEVQRRLFVDAGIAVRGHRVNILRDNMKEIGVGVATGLVSGFHSAMTTADLAYSGSATFLTGVAYKDTVKPNKFYNVGEGLAGIIITATRAADGKVFTTTTWSSGGYTLPLPAGVYSVRASNNLFPPTSSTITIKDKNVKVDFLPAAMVDQSAPTATLLATRRVRSSRTRTLRVLFKDDTLLDASTISTGDLLITGPNNFSRSARLISFTPSHDASIITATYRITAPSTGWGPAARYTIKLTPKSVQDTLGHFNHPKKLGSFTIKPN